MTHSTKKKKSHAGSNSEEQKSRQGIPQPPIFKSDVKANTNQDEAAIGNKEKKNMFQEFPGFRKYFWDMFINEKSGFWTMVFTAVLTVFTLLLVYVTNNLVYVTDKVDDTARITQRAFMSSKGFVFAHAVIDPKTNINKTASHRFIGTWENSGTTPTKIALAYASYQRMTDRISDGFAYADIGNQPITPVVVGPKQDVSTGPLDIPVADIQAKKHLYFWGWMEYYDIFDGSPRHLTEFCYEVNFVGDVEKLTDLKTPPLAYFFSDCKEHNCYDETCKDYKEHDHLKR